MSAPIHVALTFNDRYWALAYAVMRSICLTTTRRADLVFHLCHTPLAAGHAEVLETIPTEFGARLAHYDPLANPAFAELAEILPATERFPPIVYARLILDRLLPPEIERVIYLDCDVMVCLPIEMLFDADMAGRPVAAVADSFHLGLTKGRDIRTRQSPFDTGEPYFNSGVMLIDRAGYARADILGRIRDFAAQGTLAALFYDQDILNLVFRGNWTALDWRFNLLEPRAAHEPLQPVIVHYTGHQQPWNLWSSAAFHRTYRHVMTNSVYYRFWREKKLRQLRSLFGMGRR